MKCDFGDAVEKLLGRTDSLVKKNLQKLMEDALVTAAAYLVNEWQIKVQVVFDAKFLHPKKQQARNAPGAISRLTRTIVSSLPEETIKKEIKVTSSSERQEEETSHDCIDNYWEKVLYQATRN